MPVEPNKIICGDAIEQLRKLPAESINCCVSSPPYWALRDYGVDGQLGLEKTFEEYIDKLCGIYDEVKRVLRPDGTCFVNLGDTYANPVKSNRHGLGHSQLRGGNISPNERWNQATRKISTHSMANIPAKSLCLIPQRFAIEMVNRGWILRNVIIWHKPNPMPSSAKDRFTVDFEQVYFFVKQKRYWFEPQYEPQAETTENRYKYPIMTGAKEQSGAGRPNAAANTGGMKNLNPLGRNKRTVWTIPTQAYSEAHFATFPEKLVKPMIKSGCPEFVCTKCGKGREKVYETEFRGDSNKRGTRVLGNHQGQSSLPPDIGKKDNWQFKGYTDCGCGAEYRPGVVIDCFAGSGTVGKVAAQLRRNYILIDLKQEYCDMARERVNEGETGIPVSEARKGQMSLYEQEQEQ